MLTCKCHITSINLESSLMNLRKRRRVLPLLAFCCVPLWGQTPTGAITPEPGITLIRLLDRPEVRVSRLELQPGATRQVHAHDDVSFHLFVVLTGTIQFSMGSEQSEGMPGKVFFLKKGTKHGFKNSGSVPATALEIFIKNGASVADRDALAPFLALAASQAADSDRASAVGVTSALQP